jgi:hypothetical protein
MKNQLIFMAAITLCTSGIQAGDTSPAILKKLGAKQGVEVLHKGKMSEVRGEAIIPLNLGSSTLTIRLLEPNTVLRLTSVGTTTANPGGTGGSNLLGLIFLNNAQPASPATTHTVEYGVLDRGVLIHQTSTSTVNP